MRLRGTKDFDIPNDPANTTGHSKGYTTSSYVSLDDVMAKLNDMSTQMTGFSSILSGLQKDVNDLKSRFMGSSKGDSLAVASEDHVEEHSLSDSPDQP
jgi:hypothetical protein